MEPDRSLPTVLNRLIAASETLAALGLHLAAAAGDVQLSPELAQRVAAVARTMAEVDGLDRVQARQGGAIARAMLAQAAAFSAHPDQPHTWAITDPLVLQNLGQASAAFAPLFRDVIAPHLPGCAEALAGDAQILDVGVGVAAMAIALARTFPSAQVVGLDVWDPALALARRNVTDADLDDRIEIRTQNVAALDEDGRYDLVWYAGPFIPAAVQAEGLARCAAALKPGAWLCFGAFAGGDPLSSALADLRTLRSGGPVLTDAEIASALVGAGLESIERIPLEIGLPARIVAGRRPVGDSQETPSKS